MPVQGSATNLVPNARYHVRLAADNGSGLVFGPDQTFTTPKSPAPPPPSGTKWTTTDRCDGTLVAVQLHSVLVNDLVKRINVVVTAGRSYLARARR